MILIARGYLYLLVVVFAAIGVTALVSPATIATQFQLAMEGPKGISEVRCLYGGGFIAWAGIILGGQRAGSLADGLLAAMATIMGCIALSRSVSLALDGAIDFNLPAAIAEALIALACWTILRHRRAA